jgi:NitT/TauT family transport system permease protein
VIGTAGIGRAGAGAADSGPAGRRRRPAGSGPLQGALGIAGLAGAGELAGRAGLIDQTVLPLPSTVLARAGALVADQRFLGDVRATLTTWALGLAFAIAVAVPAGAVLGALRPVEASVFPLIEFLRPIPSVSLIPLVLLMVHDDLTMKVVVACYAATWPVLINTMYGLRGVDPMAKETLRSFGFGPLAITWRVLLPGAAPFIATGVRLAASIALVVAIGAELLGGGSTGIGIFIIQAGSGGGRPDLMIAATLWAGVLGLAINALFTAAERRLFRWHHALAEGPA